jgi:hypothetical protein
MSRENAMRDLSRPTLAIMCASASLWALTMASADAAVIFDLANSPQPGAQDILFGAAETGPTIQAATDISDSAVNFSSTETLLQNSSGLAQLRNNAHGSLNDVTVTAPGFTFTGFSVNLNDSFGSKIDISVTANDGTFTDSFTGKPASNFVTILATGGETIFSINFFSPNHGWEEFKDPQASIVAALLRDPPIPEPTTYSMLLLGFAGLGFAALRRTRKERLGAY